MKGHLPAIRSEVTALSYVESNSMGKSWEGWWMGVGWSFISSLEMIEFCWGIIFLVALISLLVF